MGDFLALAIQIFVPLLLMLVGFISGTWIERSHYADIRKREAQTRTMPVITFRRPPPSWQVESSALVQGSTVVSVDYFKRFLAALRALVGGWITSYESLLDRARREAILRMKEDALASGHNAVVNVRLETSRMASSNRKGQGTAGVEILAFGTALRLGDSQA